MGVKTRLRVLKRTSERWIRRLDTVGKGKGVISEPLTVELKSSISGKGVIPKPTETKMTVRSYGEDGGVKPKPTKRVRFVESTMIGWIPQRLKTRTYAPRCALHEYCRRKCFTCLESEDDDAPWLKHQAWLEDQHGRGYDYFGGDRKVLLEYYVCDDQGKCLGIRKEDLYVFPHLNSPSNSC